MDKTWRSEGVDCAENGMLDGCPKTQAARTHRCDPVKFPETLMKLFACKNFRKLILKVAETSRMKPIGFVRKSAIGRII
jgi:hypothetical protein